MSEREQVPAPRVDYQGLVYQALAVLDRAHIARGRRHVVDELLPAIKQLWLDLQAARFAATRAVDGAQVCYDLQDGGAPIPESDDEDYAEGWVDGCGVAGDVVAEAVDAPAPVKFDASAPELTAQWEPPAKPIHVRADGSMIDSAPSDWHWMALEAWRWIAYARIQLGPSRFDLDDTGHLVDKPVTPASSVADDPAKPWPRECAAQYLPDTVRADGSKMDLPAEPEPRGCPTPGACAAVAANCYLPMDCPRCGRRRLEASIATDGRRPFVSAIVCEKCGLVGSDEESEPARLRDEAEVRAEGAKWMRNECVSCIRDLKDLRRSKRNVTLDSAIFAIRALPTEREDDDG